MPFVTRAGARLYWKLDGASDRQPILLLNSIGSELGLWDLCMPHLLSSFSVLRMDTRGHGASDAPGGDYSMGELANDVIAVLQAAHINRAAVAGVSLGGMMAMELAIAAPERVSSLALICTSASMDRTAWAERVRCVREGGVTAIAELAMSRFLAPAFAQSNPQITDTVRRSLLSTSDAGYAGAAAAIRDMLLIERLPSIVAPTLVVAGKLDISTPFEGHGDRIAATIPGARPVHLDTAHLAPLEAPAVLAATMRQFVLGDNRVG